MLRQIDAIKHRLRRHFQGHLQNDSQLAVFDVVAQHSYLIFRIME